MRQILVTAGNSAALDGWESVGLANLCKTTLYKDLRRLVDRCRVVFGCLDMEYDIDDLVLDYIVYRCAQEGCRNGRCVPQRDALTVSRCGCSAIELHGILVCCARLSSDVFPS